MMFTLSNLVARDGDAAARPNLKVLVVDDHEAARKALQLVFRRLKCRTEVAENGYEAVNLLRQSQYDLVFMDLMMPVMDGLAATRQIRQERPTGAGPRIVGISADFSAESRELCLSVGMDDFLAKPLEERRADPDPPRSLPRMCSSGLSSRIHHLDSRCDASGRGDGRGGAGFDGERRGLLVLIRGP